MKQLTQRDLDEIARYLDDELSVGDRVMFEQRLGEDETLRHRYASLLETHQLLKDPLMQMPAKNFTERVMDGLAHYNPPAVGFSVRNGLLLLGGVLVAGLLAVFLMNTGMFNGTITITNPVDVSLSEKLFQQPLPAFSMDGKLLVNIIVLLNLLLAWLVLDRTILRPLFRRRMNSIS